MAVQGISAKMKKESAFRQMRTFDSAGPHGSAAESLQCSSEACSHFAPSLAVHPGPSPAQAGWQWVLLARCCSSAPCLSGPTLLLPLGIGSLVGHQPSPAAALRRHVLAQNPWQKGGAAVPRPVLCPVPGALGRQPSACQSTSPVLLSPPLA